MLTLNSATVRNQMACDLYDRATSKNYKTSINKETGRMKFWDVTFTDRIYEDFIVEENMHCMWIPER